jgi:16S rRNA (uracil1498-N3)-methyltransferase
MPTLEAGEKALLRDAIADLETAGSIGICIGPEGDFTPDEVAFAAKQGARLVSLGRLVLRAETAAVAVLATLQQLCDWTITKDRPPRAGERSSSTHVKRS